MAFCTNCGHQLADGAKFCYECGSKAKIDISNRAERSVNCKQLGIIQKFAATLARLETGDQIVQVKDFPIPDSKEDLMAFFVLAASSINCKRYNDIDGGLSSEERDLSDAWEFKFNQSYDKAIVTLVGTPEFNNINALYQKKTNEIAAAKSRNKQRTTQWFIFLGVFLAVFFVFVLVVVLSQT